MPRFYFHLRRGDYLDADTYGVDCADIAAAETEARLAIADALRDAALSRTEVQGDAFEIVDAEGELKLTVPFDIKVRPFRPAGISPSPRQRSDPSCAIT